MSTGAPPLQGLRVIDFTRILAGPMCSMILSDLGAETIKIERAGVGDDTRSWGPPYRGDESTYYLSVNRGKKSVELDLRDPAGLAAAKRLIASADIVIENFRDGVMARLGLDYDSLREEHPRLIYCSIPAYATEGAGKPGYDLLMQAATGLMSVTGINTPTKVGVAILDVVTGLYAALGVVSAVHARGEDGLGQRVVVGLFDASVAALVNHSAAFLLADVVPELAGNAHPSIVPYQMFDAADAAFVLAGGNDKLFQQVAAVVERDDLLDDERFATNAGRVAHREELVAILQNHFGRRPAAEWVARLERAGVPASQVRTLQEVFASPEGTSTLVDVPDALGGVLRYVRNPMRFSRTPITEPSPPPPRLGQHTDDVLSELARTHKPEQEAS
jgi:crotonobetainyl-CoA:carnitine CoA-transferase CaiB-like acyl-CoA transferase